MFHVSGKKTMMHRNTSRAMVACAMISILSAGCVSGPKTFHANAQVPDATYYHVGLDSSVLGSSDLTSDSSAPLRFSAFPARSLLNLTPGR